MPHSEKGLRHLLIGGGSSRETEACDDARGVDGHEQTEAFVPSQAVRPSDVGGAGQPTFAPTLGIPYGHRRAVQSLVGMSLGLQRGRQMQGYLFDEAQAVAHGAIELGALGQSGEGIAQAAAGVTVEIPFAGESGPPGEDGEGYDLAGAQGCIGSGMSFFLRAGLAEVVDHNVECGEEGVHVEHEESVPFPSGSVSKLTLARGHLPLKSHPDNSHQAFEDISIAALREVAEKGNRLSAVRLERDALLKAGPRGAYRL